MPGSELATADRRIPMEEIMEEILEGINEPIDECLSREELRKQCS